MQELENIKEWINKNQINTLDPIMQTTKTLEEVGELQQALIMKGKAIKHSECGCENICDECNYFYYEDGLDFCSYIDNHNVDCKYDIATKDAIGDIVISLISLCEQAGYEFEDCVNVAWSDVKDRKGYIKDEQFIKLDETTTECHSVPEPIIEVKLNEY